MEPVFIGQCVTFVDSHGQSHDALITNVFGYLSKKEQDQHYRDTFEMQKNNEWCTQEWLERSLALEWKPPSLNLVYVSGDKTQTDPYGTQLAQRPTSIVHQSVQTAHGMYWLHKQ